MVKRLRRAAAGMQYASVLGLIAAVALLGIAAVGGNVNQLLLRVSNQLSGTGNQVVSGGSGGAGPGSASLVGWGLNAQGQLGLGDIVSPRTSPVNLVTGAGLFDAPVLMAMTNNRTGCAVRNDGRLFCWGINTNGELGINSSDTSVRSSPQAVSNGGNYTGTNAVKVSVGNTHVLALLSSGGLVAWGSSGIGEIGDTFYMSRLAPVNVATTGGYNGSNAVNLPTGLGSRSSAAILSSGRVISWGNDTNGELGDGGCVCGQDRPVLVTSGGTYTGTNATRMTQSLSGSCLLTSAGGVNCWGLNDQGQIGNGTTGGNSPFPLAVSTGALYTGTNMIDIVGGQKFYCGLISGGQVLCWGRGDLGELGTGTAAAANTPQPVSAGGSYTQSNAQSIRAAADNACLIRLDGGLSCWGTASRVGDGSATQRNAPVDIAINPQWIGSGPNGFGFIAGL